MTDPMYPSGTPSSGAANRSTTDQALHDAKAQAGEMVDQAKHQTGELMDQAKSKATSQLEQGKAQATSRLDNVASAFRATGDELRNQEQQQFAGFADGIAKQVEQVSQYLNNRNVGELIGEVERLARREPTLFLGGAFALGLLGVRFLKSSSPDRAGKRSGVSSGNSGTSYQSRTSGSQSVGMRQVGSLERSITAPGSSTGADPSGTPSGSDTSYRPSSNYGSGVSGSLSGSDTGRTLGSTPTSASASNVDVTQRLGGA